MNIVENIGNVAPLTVWVAAHVWSGLMMVDIEGELSVSLELCKQVIVSLLKYGRSDVFLVVLLILGVCGRVEVCAVVC